MWKPEETQPLLSSAVAQSGVAATSGDQLLDSDASGATSQSMLRSEWLRGVANGDFHDGPPDPTKPINFDPTSADYNPLPGWTFVDQSNGAITVYWQADSGAGSGAHLLWTIPTGTPSGSAYLHQLVALRSSQTRIGAVLPLLAYQPTAGTSVNNAATLGISEVAADGTTVLTSVTTSGSVVAPSGPVNLNLSPAANIQAGTGALDIQIGASTTGGSSDDSTILFFEVLIDSSEPYLILPDLSTPTNPPALGSHVGGGFSLAAGGVSFLSLDSAGRHNALLLPVATAPAQTAEGSVVWDSDDDVLTVGSGAATLDIGPLDATAPSTQAFGDAAAAGTARRSAHRDHKHAMPSERAASSTTPSAVGTAAIGTGTTDARADHVHATGAGTPSTQAFGDAAATGTGPAAAMTDHKHAMPANPVRAQSSTTPAAVGTAAVGTGTTDARADHVHATGAGTPSTQAFGDAAAVGSGPAAAMTDHKHAMPANPTTGAIAPTKITDSGALVLSGIIFPTISANQNDWAPTGLSTCTGIVVNGSAGSRTITGLSASGFTEGQMLWIYGISLGGGTLTLADQSASSASGNRFFCPGGTNYVINQHGGVMVVYSPTASAASPWLVLGKS